MIFRRWGHGHSIAVGVAGGWVLWGYTPWLVFAAGVLIGVLSHQLRGYAGRLVRWTDAVVRAGVRETVSEPGDPSAMGTRESGTEHGVLSASEREQERLTGLRQGEAAGIRAAARTEIREQAKRQAMREAADRFGSDLRADSLSRTGAA